MVIVVHVLVILVCCGALWLGATWLVDSAARIARRVGVSDLVIGLTVVAFGTSAPEFAATIGASLQNKPDISVGNVVGSNIFNIGFILGACAIVEAIKTKSSLIWRDGMFLLAISVLLVVMLWDLELGRIEGAVLASMLVGYLLFLFWKREAVMDEEISHEPPRSRDGLLLLGGLSLVAGGGHFLVASAEAVAVTYGVPEWTIGMTVVAAGTSVPEFAISMIALIKKHHGISAGNLIGSNLFNTLGVLGVAGLIRPLAVAPTAQGSIIAQVVLTLVVVIFMATGKKVTRPEGIVLVLLSLAIWAYNFTTGQPG